MLRRCCTFLLASLVGGCGPADDPPSAGRECTYENALPPGAVVAGHDAQAELAPLFGTWQGSLTWAAGGTTTVTCSVTQDPAEPLRRSHCSNPDGVYTYADGSLTTADGALDERTSVIVLRTFPGANYAGNGSLAFSAMAEWQWVGTIRESIGFNVAAYRDALLILELVLDQALLKPVSGSLRFTGTLLDTGRADERLVGTLAFE